MDSPIITCAVLETGSCIGLPSAQHKSMMSSCTPCAEIEPGHVNASKYLRVTEQHMTQLGLPIAGSLQPLHDDNRWAGVGQAAERPTVTQSAAATIDLTTSGMSFLVYRHVDSDMYIHPISFYSVPCTLCAQMERCMTYRCKL